MPLNCQTVVGGWLVVTCWFVGCCCWLVGWLLVGCLAAWLLGCLAAWLLGCLAAWLLGCLVAWLLGCLVAWLLGCLVAWLLGCLVAWLLGCLVACLLACLLGCLVAWLLGCLVACLLACLVAWLLGCLLACLLGCLVAWLLAWLLGCLVAWLVGCLLACLVAWLLGCLVACLLGCLVAWLLGWWEQGHATLMIKRLPSDCWMPKDLSRQAQHHMLKVPPIKQDFAFLKQWPCPQLASMTVAVHRKVGSFRFGLRRERDATPYLQPPWMHEYLLRRNTAQTTCSKLNVRFNKKISSCQQTCPSEPIPCTILHVRFVDDSFQTRLCQRT